MKKDNMDLATLDYLASLDEAKRNKLLENHAKEKKLEKANPISKNEMEIIVSELLSQFGVPCHIKGYYYLRAGILLVLKDSQFIEQVTKRLYPEIAQQHNTTSSRVERAIRHAVEVSWNRGDLDMFNKVFGNSISKERGKATNSECIAALVNYIKLQYNFN